MNENVNVCITPKGDKPVLHFSQFDNERIFTVTVLADDGKSAAVLTGLDIEFRLRKTDSHVVTIAPESVADNVITFKTTEQMCACCGQNIASVVLMKDDMVISTLDILVDIQRDILSGGLTSESDIRNLTTQIEQIVPEVVGDDYYNKQEVDDLLAEHTFDPTNYYDKSEVDDLLAEHTFDPTNYYDKSEVDDLLDDKADSDDVYTKNETDNLLSAKMDSIGYHDVVDDAAVISFTTDCNAPLDIIKGKITPVQSGTGTPSPDNVRPISGFSALNVTRTGKNLFDGSKVTTTTPSNWGVSFDSETSTLTIEHKNTYISGMPIFNIPSFVGDMVISGTFGANIDLYVNGSFNRSMVSGTSFSCTSGNVYTLAFPNPSQSTLSYKVQLELGNQATAYEPYNAETKTIALGQTVYGGHFDNKGNLVVNRVCKRLTTAYNLSVSYEGSIIYNLSSPETSDADFSKPIMCNILQYAGTSFSEFVYGTCINYLSASFNLWIKNGAFADLTEATQWLADNPTYICYYLKTPITITGLTPETVSSIAGDNNIFIDTGNLTEIAYFEGAKNNLIKLIKACQI